MANKNSGGWPSKQPGKLSGPNRDNAPPKSVTPKPQAPKSPPPPSKPKG